MPTYNYKCEDCELIQEVIHPMSGPTWVLTCENCSSEKIEKTFEDSKPPSFIIRPR